MPHHSTGPTGTQKRSKNKQAVLLNSRAFFSDRARNTALPPLLECGVGLSRDGRESNTQVGRLVCDRLLACISLVRPCLSRSLTKTTTKINQAPLAVAGARRHFKRKNSYLPVKRPTKTINDGAPSFIVWNS